MATELIIIIVICSVLLLKFIVHYVNKSKEDEAKVYP
jgi:hypothetical protein